MSTPTIGLADRLFQSRLVADPGKFVDIALGKEVRRYGLAKLLKDSGDSMPSGSNRVKAPHFTSLEQVTLSKQYEH